MCVGFVYHNDLLTNEGSDTIFSPEISVSDREGTYYATANTNIRNRSTAQGSHILAKANRGDRFLGTVEIGERSSALWLRLSDGRGFISEVNLAKSKPPELARYLGRRTIRVRARLDLLQFPKIGSRTLETIEAGTSVTVVGVTENGFYEVLRTGGGVGYLTSDRIGI